MKLSHDALIVLATQEAAFPAAQDALDRFSFLVGPLFLSMEKGKQVTAPIVRETVLQHIGLDLPRPVAEALTFRMGQNNFISSEKVGDAQVFYAKGTSRRNSSGSVIDDLIKDFRLFVDDKSLLPKITDDEILQLFMSEIFKISDLLNEEEFTVDGGKFERWKVGIVSDYILHHTDEDGNLPPLLSKLSELCLLRSVIGSMTQQRKQPKRSTLVAILDAPIALHVTGASGKHSKKSIDATVGLANSLGVKFVVFPTSVQEMKRVLHAVLSNDHRNRRGPTATAIRRGELSETVAEDIRKDPEKYTKSFGVTTLPRNLETFPNEEHFFSEERYRDFSVTASSWSNTEAGEFHDAECLALTMRARKGNHPANILGNDYVFVTNNWKFSNAAQKKCLEYLMINEGSCPPVVHLNAFSASVWLAGGFKQESRIPEKTLLAACERALSNTGNVVEKTEKILRDLKVADESTIELLVQDRDSVNAIVSSTAGDPSLINEENIGVVLAKAKAAVAKDVSEKAAEDRQELIRQHDNEIKRLASETGKQISEIKEDYAQFKDDVNIELEARSQQIQAMEQKAKEERQQQLRNIAARVEHLNKRIQKHGWGLVETFSTVFFLIASLLMGFQISWAVGFCATLFGAFFVLFSYLEIWFPNKVKMWVIHKMANIQLKKEFSNVEIRDWKITINEEAEAVVRK